MLMHSCITLQHAGTGSPVVVSSPSRPAASPSPSRPAGGKCPLSFDACAAIFPGGLPFKLPSSAQFGLETVGKALDVLGLDQLAYANAIAMQFVDKAASSSFVEKPSCP